MGACQSQSAAATTNRGAVVTSINKDGSLEFQKSAAVEVAATPNHRGGLFRKGSGNMNINGKNAYELALVSPSERTNATQAMTPLPDGNVDYHNIANGTTSPDDQQNVNDISDLDVPSDEEIEDLDEDGPWDEEGNEEDEKEDELVDWVSQYDRTPKSLAVETARDYYDDDDDDDDDDDSYDDDYVSHPAMTMDTSHPAYSLAAATPISKKQNRRGLFSSLKKKRPDPSGLEPNVIMEDLDEPVETPSPITTGNNAPLVAPPKGVPVTFDSLASSSSSSLKSSVTPQAVANFNKMKHQAQQAEKLEKQRRQQDKIKDRRQDIQGYNDLWDEFSNIQQKVTENDAVSVISATPSTVEKVSIQDTTTWFVDFSALNPNGRLSDDEADDGDDDDDDDAKSTSSLSLHSEMSEQAQREYFKQKARKRRMSLDCNDENSTGCVSDISSENGSVVERNDDYGVLNRFKHKSIEESVMGYAEYFASETPGANTDCQSVYSATTHVPDPSVRAEVQGYSDVYSEAPTPKTVNSTRTASIEHYLEEMSLPSVSIENAETGVVRWRQFPKCEERAKTARKLEFKDAEARDDADVDQDAAEEADDVDETTPTDREVEDLSDVESNDPVISYLSTDEFFRVSRSKNGIRHIKGKSDVPRTKSIKAMAKKFDRQPKAPVPSVVVGGTAAERMEHRELLARKVGTKLESLIDQLKEKGLGQ
ncbi:MAG: hypothetical protein SGILL_006201 [Bacillariaceae sp.]